MNVSLTPELQKFIRRKLGSGRYQTASEVVREGLRLLEERERSGEAQLRRLREDIARGLEDLNANRTTTFNVGRIKRRGRARLKAARARKSA